MALHNRLGQEGERLARNYFEAQGYEILDENWCFGKAEIDLIVYKNGRIVFVEVKSRSSDGFGQPEEFVDESKQRNMIKAAEEYIHIMDFGGEIRFDIVSLLFNKTGGHTLNHIEDAFW